MPRPQVPGPLALAALGVVFGDIGTSPLYTLSTCFTTANVAPTLANTLGIISLIAWALIIVVCIKYVSVLMRVDHEGEGGILALLALASPPRLLGAIHGTRWLIPVVVLGAAMLIGDGMITPAISVVSAVEGLNVATSAAQPFIVPISVAVLLALFLIQSRGTQSVGSFFGPVMLLWFVAIAIAGARAIALRPVILQAIDPLHGLWFIFHHGVYGFLIFGGVILCITGAEALYADLSHFGRIPITWAWYGVVFPALLLNYFGQGAKLLADPQALDSPFYALMSGGMLIPMVVLATLATVIASQALISGAFTLCEQAIAMNLSPRMRVVHTSQAQRGQVYIPFINVLLAVVCLILVVTFRSSAHLAAAYGLAVACTMLATSVAFFVVATRVFHWRKRYVLPGISLFVLIDALFVLSGLPKFIDGAWVPLAVSALVAFVSLTWLKGRRSLARALAVDQMPIARFLAEHPRPEAPVGQTVMLTNDPSGVPFVHNHRWMPAFLSDKKIVLLTLNPAARPYVEQVRRVAIEQLAPSLFVVKANFGYMEEPSLRHIFRACKKLDFMIDDEETTFFYSAPIIVGRPKEGMKRYQRALFAWLSRVSRSLVDDMEVPPDRRVGLGVEIQI
ncbi:MAG TPA: KUP/HAK/KT family potassium transporter [Alphaproteobacteria bacterium]|nr:KUP/HAK/KT family potassium transporter [Alphaproteobacteria bacterium]